MTSPEVYEATTSYVPETDMSYPLKVVLEVTSSVVPLSKLAVTVPPKSNACFLSIEVFCPDNSIETNCLADQAAVIVISLVTAVPADTSHPKNL